MSKSEIESKPVVGDDGELLNADTNIDMVVYQDYATGPYPPPTRLERLQYEAINNPIVWVTILLLLSGIAIVMWYQSSQVLPYVDPDEVRREQIFATMTSFALSTSVP